MKRDYLVRSTAEREERHRRTVLLATGVLILLATSPVLVHHVGSQLDRLLAGRDHLWTLCVIALHQILAPVHEVFHGLLVAGLLYATWDRARAMFAVRRTLGALEWSRPAPGDGYWEAASSAAVPASAIRIVEGLPNPAFTAGWWRPRIYLTRSLRESLGRGELAAVLAHEYAHVRRRDPARLSFLRFLGSALFWIPALRRLAADVADDAEIAADDAAVRGEPLVLASAILQLAAWRVPASASAAAIAALSGEGSAVTGFRRNSLLDRRIRRLAGEEAAVVTHVTRRSLAAAMAGLMLVWMSGLAVAHPLPDGTAHASAHCEHQHEWAFQHLFCLAGHARTHGAQCPHSHLASRAG